MRRTNRPEATGTADAVEDSELLRTIPALSTDVASEVADAPPEPNRKVVVVALAIGDRPAVCASTVALVAKVKEPVAVTLASAVGIGATVGDPTAVAVSV